MAPEEKVDGPCPGYAVGSVFDVHAKGIEMPRGGKLIEDARAEVVRTNTGAGTAGAVVSYKNRARSAGGIRVDPDGIRPFAMAGGTGDVAIAVGAVPTSVRHDRDDKRATASALSPERGR